jgi:hypothetical protein
MRNRAIAIVCATTAAAMLLIPASTAGAGNGDLRALHGGKQIALMQVAQFHCHDASFPVIECFDTALERDLDFAVTPSGVTSEAVSNAPTASYVTWFDAINYGGSSFTASVSYSDLGVLGWNDRISSFKSLNGGRPKWWRDTGFLGTAWRWPAGAQVPNVGTDANDQWSSVANVP